MPNLTSIGVTAGVPTSGTGTVSTIDSLMADGGQVTIGAVADAAVSNPASSGSLVALLKGNLTLAGGVTETAPASDTASSGMNGRLQRIAQRISSFLALFTSTAATDGNRLPVSVPDAATGSGSVSSAATLFTVDTTGYASMSIQVTSAGTSCTITYEGSNDGGTTWQTVAALRIDITTASAASTTSTAVPVILQCATKQIRARVSTYGSGTVSASYALRTLSVATHQSISVFNTTPAFFASANTATTNTATQSRVAAAASTNATSVKGSAGNLFSLALTNNTASAKYVKFYNKATSPTVGTDTPVITFVLQASSNLTMDWSNGLGFSTGIAYAITGAVGDSDTTAVSANDVHGVIGYK